MRAPVAVTSAHTSATASCLTSAMVAHTIRCLAGVKQVGVADMCELVTATGARIFGPW